CQGYSRSALTF
nr:immunoglobulin light chain junction region [Macaca mulatta]